ncbi:uncharacterized protein LOC128558116 [Mercenaria mercenaria]|uniref:uncharacterized protein LOC128558116 n=1 Tax=Mercenaria mercenaria TaxID=6596 RepID=UPI00234EA6FC|nr:uncharacterized protein LOC128558116 [Mercenaria mercenaria]
MERASHVIKVQYYVKVVIDIPKLNGGDATVILPITLGTIPQGHKAVPVVQGASNIPVIDASSAITYTQCVDGYEDGPKIWEDKLFPRFTYVPWCTYVPDFKPLVTRKNVSPKNITKPVNSGKSNVSGDSKQSPNKVEGSVIKPAISNQMRAQPTAPPISDNPPTYDEAMKDMESFPVQKPLKENSDSQEECLAGSNESETAGEQDNNTADQSDQHCIIMIIRFADTCLKQFRSTVKQNGAKLTKTSGKIIAVAPQVLVIKGSWPAQTSIAVLSFETFESGSEWFKSFQESNGAPGVDIFDCVMLKGSDEEFQNEKNVFTLSFMRRKGDITSEEFKDVTKKVREIIKPIRFELGGRLICSGAVEKNLSEQTLSTDNIVALFQWDSIRQKDDYTSLLKEKYKSILISLAKFYTTETQTIFQTENTSYMVEDTS